MNIGKDLCLLLVIVLVSGATSFACDCLPPRKLSEARPLEFDRADVVFTGTVTHLSNDQRTFSITVNEVWKGNLLPAQVLPGINRLRCAPNADHLGMWLIYGRMENDTLILVPCGLSRSFEHPERNRYFQIPPVPESTKNDTDLPKNETRESERHYAKQELQDELNYLRKREDTITPK